MDKRIGTHGKRYEYKGKLYTLRDLCKIFKVGYSAVEYRRRKLGMSLFEALTESPEEKKRNAVAICPPDCKWGEWHCHEIVCMYLDLHKPPQRRPCPPGEKCTVYEPGKRKNTLGF